MTALVRRALEHIARPHRWDADALYALASLSTDGTFALDAGVERWTPKSTRVGLFQFPEHVARKLGVAPSPHPPRAELATTGGRWATWTLAAMDLNDQVQLIERFLKQAFAHKGPRRPLDYYLAAWGAAPGLPASTVISLAGEDKFVERFDGDSDGKLTVADLDRALASELKRTRAIGTTPLFDACWWLFTFAIARRLK